jgi:hypothetical protein
MPWNSDEIRAAAPPGSCFALDPALMPIGDPATKRMVVRLTCDHNEPCTDLRFQATFQCRPKPTYKWATSEWGPCGTGQCDGSNSVHLRDAWCQSSDPAALPSPDPLQPNAGCTDPEPATSERCVPAGCAASSSPPALNSAAATTLAFASAAALLLAV